MKTIEGQSCILFEKQPPETNYLPGTYSWVESSTAQQYIDGGYAKEFDPTEIRKARKLADEKPASRKLKKIATAPADKPKEKQTKKKDKK